MRDWRYEAQLRVFSLCRRFGFDLRRFNQFGVNPLADVAYLRGPQSPPPVVLDVGANIGQTVRHVRDFFPDAVLHCFEPSTATFAELSRGYGNSPGVHLNNVGVGSRRGERELFNNELNVLSSFLPLGDDGWGSVEGSEIVPMTTVDVYCQSWDLEKVDLLKIDTQGFELEVLQGAEETLSEKRIDFILAEANFAALYVGSPSLFDICSFLGDAGLELVSLYNLRHVEYRAGWADVLFAPAR